MKPWNRRGTGYYSVSKQDRLCGITILDRRLILANQALGHHGPESVRKDHRVIEGIQIKIPDEYRPFVADPILTLRLSYGSGEMIRFGFALGTLAMQSADQVDGSKKNLNPTRNLELSQPKPPFITPPNRQSYPVGSRPGSRSKDEGLEEQTTGVHAPRAG